MVTELPKKFDVKALKQKALQSDDVVYDTFYVKKWDAEFPIKTLVGADVKAVMKHRDDPIRSAILAVVYGCVTPDGERVFDNEREAVAAFETTKGIGEITQLAKRIMEISGLSDIAVSEAKND